MQEEMQITIIFIVDLFVVDSFIRHLVYKMVRKAHHIFPGTKATSSECLFFPANSPKLFNLLSLKT